MSGVLSVLFLFHVLVVCVSVSWFLLSLCFVCCVLVCVAVFLCVLC